MHSTIIILEALLYLVQEDKGKDRGEIICHKIEAKIKDLEMGALDV